MLWVWHFQHMLTNIQQLCGLPTAMLTFKPAKADVPRWCYSPNNQSSTPQFQSKTKYPTAMHQCMETSWSFWMDLWWFMFSGFCPLYFVRILTSLVSRNRFGPRSHLSKSSSCFAHLAWSHAGVWRVSVTQKAAKFNLPARKHSQEVQQKGNQTTMVLLSFACGPAQESICSGCGRA